MIKKILFISHEASESGAPIVLLNLLQWLKENKNEYSFELLLLKDGPLKVSFENLCKVYCLSSGTSDKVPRQLQNRLTSLKNSNILKKMSGRRYDLVYVNTIANGNLVHTLKKYLPVPFLVHVHEMGLTIREFGRENMEKIFENADIFIADSSITALQLNNLLIKQGNNSKPVHMVWEFITPKQEVIAKNRLDNNNLVGCAGSFSWRKGVELFLLVALAVVKKNPRVMFQWIGGNHASQEYLRYQYLVNLYGLKSNVEFVSHTDRPENYLANLDLFFLSSVEEPFSLVCIEAALQKKPVICFSGCSGMEELLIPAAGIAVAPGDISAASEAILSLIKNAPLRKQMGEAGRRLVLEHAVTEVGAPKIAAIIESILYKEF